MFNFLIRYCSALPGNFKIVLFFLWESLILFFNKLGSDKQWLAIDNYYTNNVLKKKCFHLYIFTKTCPHKIVNK